RVDHREEDHTERLLLVVHVQQVVNVRNAHLRRETRIDSSTLSAFLIKLLRGVVRVDEVLCRYPQTFEVRREKRIGRVLIQRSRNSDSLLAALLQKFVALLLIAQQRVSVRRIAHRRRVRSSPHCARRYLNEIRIRSLYRIQPLLDDPHVGYIFDQALLAGISNDQTLDAREYRDLRLSRRFRVLRTIRQPHVNERPQTFVLTEVAASVLVAMGLIGDLLYSIETHEGTLLSVLPQTNRFNGCANRSRLSAVFVNYDS